MSHLIKNNFLLKKILNIFLFSVLIIVLIFSTLNYDGNKIIFLTYGLLINLILLNGLKKDSYFFEFFFGILLWLGFWLKLVFIVNYYSFAFNEGAGDIFQKMDIENQLILLDESLVISIVAFISYFTAVIFKKLLFSKINYNFNKIEKKVFFSKFQNILLIILFACIIFIAFFNLDNLIYQRGLKSQSSYNFLINGSIKWLLLFGFSSFVSFFIFINLKNKKKIYQLSFFSIIETFISNVSYLSRGMVFNALSIFYGLYKSNKIYKLNLKIKFFIIYFLLISIFFFVSTSGINYLRHNYYYNTLIKVDKKEKINVFDSDKIIIQREKKYDTLSKAINEFYFLAINRWVGIDAVVSIVSKKDKNWNTFFDSFKEKYDPRKLPYYERVVQIRDTKMNENQLNYGITTPGIVSFLFYSGSKIFLSLSFFSISLLMMFFEKFILNKTTNLIFCALIIQQVAYRLIHFGYMPLNSYLFFGTIIITIILHQVFLYLLKKI